MYTVYADDSTFFLKEIFYQLKNLVSIVSVDSFNQFCYFFGLKANIEKCEIADIGSLKGVTEAVCGLKSTDLSNDRVKILGIHFSYSKNVQMQNNVISTIKKIQKALRLWNSLLLTLEGRIMIFKTLAISKIVYLVLITNVPKVIVEELKYTKKINTQKIFMEKLTS